MTSKPDLDRELLKQDPEKAATRLMGRMHDDAVDLAHNFTAATFHCRDGTRIAAIFLSHRKRPVMGWRVNGNNVSKTVAFNSLVAALKKEIQE